MPRELPLSIPQRDILAPSGPTENCLLSFSFGRRIQPARWKTAWEVLLQRHPILRSALSGGRRSLLEFDNLDTTWNEPDWSALPREELAAKWAEIQTACRSHVFDPGTSPSWLLHLIALPGGIHHFLWTLHPVLLDEASASQLLLEWVRLYEQLPEGASAGSWPATPSPSAAVGAIEFPDAPSARAIEQLESPLLESVDPFALLHAPEISNTHETETVQLTSELAEVLERLRAECDATHDQFLAVLWGYWLASQNATGEALVAARFDLRGHLPSEYQEVRARFETRLPCLIKPPGFGGKPAAALRPLCETLRALEPDVFADWQSRANVLAARIGNVAVPVCDIAWRTAELNDVLHTAMPMWLDADATWSEAFRVPLALRAAGEVRVKLRLHVAKGFLPPAIPRALLAAFVTFLENLEVEPAEVVDSTDSPAPEEFRLEAHEPPGIPLEEALRSGAGAPAVIYGGDTNSYSDLFRFSNQLIRFLRRQKPSPETRILFTMRPTPWMVIGALALLRDGVDFLALDPGSLPEDLAAFCAEHRIGMALCDSSTSEALAAAGIKALPVDTLWEKIGVMPDNDPGERKLAQSGGGFLLPGGNGFQTIPFALLRGFLSRNLSLHALEEGDRLLLHGSCDQLSTIEEILAAVRSNATMVIPRADIFATRSAFQETLETHAVTHLALDPFRWANWVHFLGELRMAPPAPLRRLLLEGGRLTKKCAETWASCSGGRVETTLFFAPGGCRSIALSAPWQDALSAPIEKGLPLGALPNSIEAAAVSNNGRIVPGGLPGKLRIRAAVPVSKEVGEAITNLLPLDAAPTCVHGPDGIWRATRFPGLQEHLARPLLGRIESAFLAHEGVFDVVVRENPPGSGKLGAWVVPMDSQGGFPSGLAASVKRELGGAWDFAEAAVLFKFPAVRPGRLAESDLPPLQAVNRLDAPAPAPKAATQSSTPSASAPKAGPPRPSFVFQEIAAENVSGDGWIVVCEESSDASLAAAMMQAVGGGMRVGLLHPPAGAPAPDAQDVTAALDSLPAASEIRFVGHGHGAWFAARLAAALEKRGSLPLRPVLLDPSITSVSAQSGMGSLFGRTLSFLSGKKAPGNARRDATSSRAFRCVSGALVVVDGEPDPVLVSYFPSAEFFNGDLSSPASRAKAAMDVLREDAAADTASGS